MVCSITKNEAVAEEIVQELFLRVWIRRTELADIENPEAWLVRIASNLSLTHIKRMATYSRILQQLESGPDNENPLNTIDAKQVTALIAAAVQQLPEKRQQIYRLSREKGLSREEIAAMLGVSESTVKNQLTAALKSIQESIRRSTGIYLPIALLLLLR